MPKAALPIHTSNETSDLTLQRWEWSSVLKDLPGTPDQALGSNPTTTKQEGNKTVRTKNQKTCIMALPALAL